MRTIDAETSYEEIIKRSRFLAIAARTDDVAQAQAWLASRSEPEATHNCWAYRIGKAYRFNDDGEPGGTAGRPILAAIEGSGLDHLSVLVIRWYGGVKLGAGGLARAYGGSAARCLDRAPVIEVIPRREVALRASFEHAALIRRLAEPVEASVIRENYDGSGLSCVVEIAADRYDEFVRMLTDSSRGQVHLEHSDPENKQS